MRNHLPVDSETNDAQGREAAAACGQVKLAAASRRAVLRMLPGIALATSAGLLLAGCGENEDDGEDDD